MKLNQLCIALHSIVIGSMLTTVSHAQTTNADEPTATLETIVIEASASASKDGLMNEFSGGQVAVGSRVGILGDKKTIDTPFSTVAYTNDYIQNQQADSVGDVLKKDPTVRVARGFGNYQETYFMRGFLTNSDETMFNGLYGVLPRQYIASELFERVEIQRGSSAGVNSASPAGGNLGGAISLLPKRATNEPIKQITVSTENGKNAKAALDVGQRFGANNEYGVRANVAYQGGGTAIDDEDTKLGLVALGLDYRGDKLRVSSDLGYQNNQLDKIRPTVDLDTVQLQKVVPKVPKNNKNFSEKWAYSDEKDIFGTVRAEYDISDNVTAYGAYGFRKSEENNVFANPKVLNANGDTTSTYLAVERDDKIHTADIGVKGKFKLDTTSHNWVISANAYKQEVRAPWANGVTATSNNLYSPKENNLQPAINHDVANWGKHVDWGLDTKPVTSETKFSSLAVGDTVGLLDDKLQLTLVGRYQKLATADYSSIDKSKKEYEKTKFTPTVAVNYRLKPELSIYANYAESLKTSSAEPKKNPSSAILGYISNPPFVAKQTEIGMKYDNGLVGATLSAFQTKTPRVRWGSQDGKNTHQGIELSAYGSPVHNLRVLGGLTYLKTEQKNTATANINGKREIGVPQLQANVGVEYDVTKFDGLTLTGDIIHTGSRYADDANLYKVDGYTTLDIGARYKTQIAGKDVTIKGVVANATDKSYWGSVGGYPGYGYLTVGEPRTLKLSASFDF